MLSHPPRSRRRPRILIAHTDHDFSHELSSALKALRFSVFEADNAIRCCETIELRKPNLLILGVNLPWGGSDGVLTRLEESATSPRMNVFLLLDDSQMGNSMLTHDYDITEVLGNPITVQGVADSCVEFFDWSDRFGAKKDGNRGTKHIRSHSSISEVDPR
jgi:DNA-binding NtrC family response regulator